MPRVKALKKTYMPKDLRRYISGEMKDANITQEQMGRELNLTQQSFSHRLKEANFTYMQLVTIFQKLGSSEEDIIKMMKV